MSTTTNDFQILSTLDAQLDDTLSLSQDHVQGIAMPCACFQEDVQSEEQV